MIVEFKEHLNSHKALNSEKGFSMVELLGAIAITMLLAASLTLVVASTSQMLAEVEMQTLQGLKTQQILS